MHSCGGREAAIDHCTGLLRDLLDPPAQFKYLVSGEYHQAVPGSNVAEFPIQTVFLDHQWRQTLVAAYLQDKSVQFSGREFLFMCDGQLCM